MFVAETFVGGLFLKRLTFHVKIHSPIMPNVGWLHIGDAIDLFRSGWSCSCCSRQSNSRSGRGLHMHIPCSPTSVDPATRRVGGEPSGHMVHPSNTYKCRSRLNVVTKFNQAATDQFQRRLSWQQVQCILLPRTGALYTHVYTHTHTRARARAY